MHAKLLAFTGALLVAPLSVALASPVSQLVVFGDSLSDNGNAAIAQGGSIPGNYATNAYTDGPNTSPATSGPYGLWIDQFAAKIGVADPRPYLANPLSNTNYAVGSALSGAVNPQDIGNQVAAFTIAHPAGAPSTALYTIWGGANDLFNGASKPGAVADNLFNYILTLSGEGAKNFLWLNLPNLGNTPLGAPFATILNGETALFNAEWALDITTLKSDGVNVTGVDINSLFNQIQAARLAYGFANVSQAAQNQSVDPNTYLFWDDEHPTTAGDALVANTAFNAYEAPEPLSAGLSIIGLATVLAVLKLRRKHIEV